MRLFGHIRIAARGTVRFRLAAIYGGLFLAVSAGMLTVIYLLFRNYDQVVGYRPILKGTLVVTARPPAARPAVHQTAAAATEVRIAAVLQHASDLHRLLVEFAIALGVMAVVATVIGWLVAGRVLRPLRTITARARDLSARDLHNRLALEGPPNELKDLADTFDGFLARLESSFESQRRFVHNASHELRTPLARQRTLLEVALRNPAASVETLRSSCERVLATGEEQERLIDGLLTLARSDQRLEHRECLDLAELTRSVVDSRAEEFETKDLRLGTELDSVEVPGDLALIERLIANLVDNAIEHNVTGGRVDVRTSNPAGVPVLTVRNDGRLLSEEDMSVLGQPLEHRRQRWRSERGHHGLGLAIIRAVATAHGAELTIRRREVGGLDVEVRFRGVGSVASTSPISRLQ